MAPQDDNTIILTADIVAAHLSHNFVQLSDIPELIQNVFRALSQVGDVVEPVLEKPKGAVSVRASLQSEYLISMIDGKRYKMLKRHLTLNGYTPSSYRETFGLPKDYPMVAPDYASARRTLALELGLGGLPKTKRGQDDASDKVSRSAKKAPKRAK